MTTVTLSFDDPSISLEVRSVSGIERLGEPSRHELSLFSKEPVEVATVLRKPCALRFANDAGERTCPGSSRASPAS